MASMLYRYDKSVAAVFTAGRLCLINLLSGLNHVIDGPAAEKLARFVYPSPFECEMESELIGSYTMQFIRLLNTRFVIALEVETTAEVLIQGSEAPYWPDAFIYHRLSRTDNATEFASIETQNAFFQEVQHKIGAQAGPRKRVDVSYFPIPDTPALRMENDSLTDVLYARRSRRIFASELTPATHLFQLLNLAAGNKFVYFDKATGAKIGMRSGPSAGSFQSINVYVAALRVKDLSPGIYHYLPSEHALGIVNQVASSDWVVQAAGGQPWAEKAAFALIFTADTSMAASKYNASRVYRMLCIEAGHLSQSLLLLIEATGKFACISGAMNEQIVEEQLRLPLHEPVLFMILCGESVTASKFEEWGSVPR